MTLLPADRREHSHVRVCPVHSPAVGECWDGCLPERVALSRLAASFRQYWYARSCGIYPRKKAGRMTGSDPIPTALTIVRAQQREVSIDS